MTDNPTQTNGIVLEDTTTLTTKKSKGVRTSLITMLLFAGSFLLLTGGKIWIALGITFLVLVHEMGHYIAGKIKKLHTSYPIFIPFLGAFVRFKDGFGSRETLAFVSIAGPFLGSLITIPLFLAWNATGNQQYLVIGFLGLSLNFFNLFPFKPLDGGHIAQLVGPWFQWVAVICFAAYCVYDWQPIFIFIWFGSIAGLTGINEKQRFAYAIGVLLFATVIATVSIPPKAFVRDLLLLLTLTGFLGYMYYKDYKKSKAAGTLLEVKVDPLPYPTWQVRAFWIACYIILMVSIGWSMWILRPQLPTPLL